MRRRRLLPGALLGVALAALAVAFAHGRGERADVAATTAHASQPAPAPHPAAAPQSAVVASTLRAVTRPSGGASVPAQSPTTHPKRPRRRAPRPRVAIRVVELTVRLTDPRRTVRGALRSFLCEFRFPDGVVGREPLVVFGHGYAVTPTPYRALLDAWVRAGYVVAAPVFPLENAGAPGGPDENDLPEQPGDMSLVISSLARPTGGVLRALAARTDLRRIAVTGQSDGGDTALAVAEDPAARDRRVAAAMILSGAQDPFVRLFAMPRDGPPLLAVQGTADTINPPADTVRFFDAAARPKYLLWLRGAGHLPPYTEPGLARTEVARVTIAFLDGYLKGRPATLRALAARRTAGPASDLVSAP